MNLRALTGSLAIRLFLLIASVQTLILLGLTYAVVEVQRSTHMAQITTSATRVSDLIARSTRYSMLLNRKEDVHNIIMSVGGEPGIEGISIYNKQGEIIFGTSPAEIHTKVDIDAEACIRCHKEGLDRPAREAGAATDRIFTNVAGHRVLGLITPIRNEAQCATPGCHASPEKKTILGVLDVKMSLAQVDRDIEASRQQMLLLSVGAVLLVSLISGAFIWVVVRRPVQRLMAGMEMVSTGHLDSRLSASSSDELGQLALSFNAMTEELSHARAEITAWSRTLEQKVREKTTDLERAHREMVRVEKMASLGNLASSVAHELNNPLEGIVTFARLLIKRTAKSSLPPEETDATIADLSLMADEALRCGTIVKNLLVFARQKGVAFQTVPLGPIIERCALLMNHHARMHNVDLVTSCEDVELVECDPNQIQQMLIALMVNAIEAMGASGDRQEGGTLRLDAGKDPEGRRVRISVSDTGVGMSDETKGHIFEPFFTTKQEGKGVGLGLAVAYGIIQRHHGSIDVESALARGTTFTIYLPLRQPAKPEEGTAVNTSVEGV
ncbi:MAG: ATP-binding protein [Bacteroidota bacterium]